MNATVHIAIDRTVRLDSAEASRRGRQLPAQMGETLAELAVHLRDAGGQAPGGAERGDEHGDSEAA